MPIKYKIDVIAALKEAGYTSYRLRKEKIISQSALQLIRQGKIVSTEKLALLCELLNCQPGDILEYDSDNFDFDESGAYSVNECVKLYMSEEEKTRYKAHAESKGENLEAFILRAMSQTMQRDLEVRNYDAGNDLLF